jgi:Peptide N-acetyl-beta-D-glucosaminyl asparaginase amidase A
MHIGVLVSIFVFAVTFIATVVWVRGAGWKCSRYLGEVHGADQHASKRCSSQERDESGSAKRTRPRSQIQLPYWAVWISIISILGVYYSIRLPPRMGSLDYKTPPTENSLMQVFQVYQPPPTPAVPDNCEILLMDHIFGFSYGKPFVGSYHPPSCLFNSVSMTLTITSRGRQFDRLALMFLGDVEVFRTSTAEPTAQGIVWTYRKDMTAYLALWRKPQKVVFDLGNLVDEMYTATFNATLAARFFEAEEPAQTADVILPISARRSGVGGPSAFSLPSDNATVAVVLPGGVSRAIISISACGQATEEFWYSNVLSSDTGTFLNTTGPLYGFSPFREVQLLIDGYLAGVVWPFPTIFTGGIAPGFWRPIVGLDAFDLREPEIDVTPWVPWLSDGKEHEFQIRVVGLEGEGEDVGLSGAIGDYWVVTGKILVFLGEEKSFYTKAGGDDLPSIFAPPPAINAKSAIKQSANGTNETLSYSVTASRNIVTTSKAGSWVQNLEFASDNILTSEGLTQSTTQHTKGDFAAINFRDPRLSFSVATSYPLFVNTTIGVLKDSPGMSIDASLFRGLTIDSTGRPDLSLFTMAYGESRLDTTQFGAAHYSSQPNQSYSFGDTTQEFLESSRQGVSIVHVEAVNGSVASTDHGSGQNDTNSGSTNERLPSIEDTLPYRSPRSMVGRGPVRLARIPP